MVFGEEFELRGLPCLTQKLVVVAYKGFTREEPLRFDMLVADCVLVEVLSYMKLLDVPVGLLINFHETKLTDGIHRLILQGADH